MYFIIKFITYLNYPCDELKRCISNFFPYIASKYLLTFFSIRKFYSKLFFSLLKKVQKWASVCVCTVYFAVDFAYASFEYGFDRSFLFSLRALLLFHRIRIYGLCWCFRTTKTTSWNERCCHELVFFFMCHNSSYYAVTTTIKEHSQGELMLLYCVSCFFALLLNCVSSTSSFGFNVGFS